MTVRVPMTNAVLPAPTVTPGRLPFRGYFPVLLLVFLCLHSLAILSHIRLFTFSTSSPSSFSPPNASSCPKNGLGHAKSSLPYFCCFSGCSLRTCHSCYTSRRFISCSKAARNFGAMMLLATLPLYPRDIHLSPVYSFVNTARKGEGGVRDCNSRPVYHQLRDNDSTFSRVGTLSRCQLALRPCHPPFFLPSNRFSHPYVIRYLPILQRAYFVTRPATGSRLLPISSSSNPPVPFFLPLIKEPLPSSPSLPRSDGPLLCPLVATDPFFPRYKSAPAAVGVAQGMAAASPT